MYDSWKEVEQDMALMMTELKALREKIVLCKECKYWCPNQKFQNDSVYYCSKLGVDMKAVDFCSRGVRR